MRYKSEIIYKRMSMLIIFHHTYVQIINMWKLFSDGARFCGSIDNNVKKMAFLFFAHQMILMPKFTNLIN